jgi:MATE family multidrug resistance protein
MTTTPATLASNVVTQGSPASTVLKLASPTVLAMLTQSVVNEIDIVFFSWLPFPESSNAQAALLPSLILLWMFGGALSAISVGTQTITARRFAQQRWREAGGVLANSWMFSLVASVTFTVLSYATLPYVIPLIIKVPAVQEAAHGYLKWRLLGITSMVMTFSFKAFFDGIGKTYVHMASAIIMNALNVVLCLLLIFGRGGLPRLGIVGAGMAAFISTWVGLLIMVGWALAPSIRCVFSPFALSRWSARVTWNILRLSVPSGVATLAVMSGFLLFSIVVSRLDSPLGAPLLPDGTTISGTEPVNSASTTVIVGILKLTFTACLAFGTSTATLVSQSLGEGNSVKAERFGWVSVQLGLAIFGVVGLLEGVFFPHQILAFVSQSEAVRQTALMPLRMMGICTPFIAVGMILTQALFGAGNSRFVMLVELILHFLCLVPLAWLLGVVGHFGLVGVWSAGATYILLLAGVMTWKFARGDWKTIRV